MANHSDFVNSNSHTKLLQLFGTKPKCQCQQAPQRNQLLPAHLQYDLVKKCRQCRRIIRDYSDSDTEQSGTEFCECLLQNTVEREGETGENSVSASPEIGNQVTLDVDHEVLDRCESADALDESGLPSYKTAAKLSLIAFNQ